MQFPHLSGDAWKLLNQFVILHNGHNNGRLRVAWEFARKHGWKSRSKYYAALCALLDHQLITVTRPGKGSAPHLVALTWVSWTDPAGEIRPPTFILSEKKIAAAHLQQHRLDAKVINEKKLTRQKSVYRRQTAKSVCVSPVDSKSHENPVCCLPVDSKRMLLPAVSIPVEQCVSGDRGSDEDDDLKGVF
ncbi:hypothetical protein [Paraburkholderia atlantica]|uniref:hypothetical protein n=1 Tax=Paraburkholderia atlantica TaxID=2654982 RepID=UPI003D1C6014